MEDLKRLTIAPCISGAIQAAGGLRSVQFSLVAQSCLTLCDPLVCSTPGFPVHHQLLDFAQTHVIESVMPSHHLILCRPLLPLPLIFPSIREQYEED